MGNITYDLADKDFNTEHVANAIIEHLNKKYDREFKVVKIGERFGTGFTNEVTALCTVTNFSDFIFRATYNMVDEKLVYDNFLIRCTCFYVEREINKLLKYVNSLARVEIERMNEIDNIYKTQEFLEKYSDEFFVATVVLEKNDLNNYEEILKELNNIYNNIKLKVIIYEMEPNEFSKFNENSKNIDYFSMRYVEGFKIENRTILKLENGLINFI